MTSSTDLTPAPDHTSGSVLSGRAPLRSFLRNWPLTVLLSLAWMAFVVLIVVFLPLLINADFQAMDLKNRLSPPVFLGGTWQHALGTDELGRDVLARLLVSTQTSMALALAATILSTILGVGLGFLASYMRGAVEQVILMFIDAQSAIPFMIIALAVLAFLGNSLLLFTILLGFSGWASIARVTRGLAISFSEHGFANAVRDLGASPWRIYMKHILPNIASTLVVSLTLNFPEVILLEAGLSFLGLGIQPPMTSLGSMVGYARDYLHTAPWVLLAPALVIVVTTLSMSLVGDWLRDRLDPALR
jgi:peptide/nickel transport system permease protein